MGIRYMTRQQAFRVLCAIGFVCVFSSPGRGNRIDELNAAGPQRLGRGFVSTIAMSPDDKVIATAHRTNEASQRWDTQVVLLWDLQTREQIAELSVGGVRSIAFSPDGGTLAVGRAGHAIDLWDLTELNRVGVINSPGKYSTQWVAFSPDGTLLASTVDGDNGAHLWDVQSLKHIAALNASGRCVTFSPDGALLLTGGNRADPRIKLWDVQTQAQVGALTGHQDITHEIVFSPDGNIIASAGGAWDQAVYLWDGQTQEQIGVLGGHPAHVGSAAFSPDGELVASTSLWQEVIYLWDVSTQTQLGQLKYHDVSSGLGWSHRVLFTSDGRWLACGSGDGVELWAVNLFGPIATDPQPADGATDVSHQPVLQWTPGPYAREHEIYFSADFDDVDIVASNSAPTGTEVVSQRRQDADTYLIPGALEFGQTYYWRVDEINGPPDYTVFQGDVWSFTTEPFAYPIENVVATSNAVSNAGAGPENTINGSGLDENDGHSIAATDMWLGTPVGADPVWIQYEFDAVYKLHEMWVWNYNVQFEPVLGFGLRDVTIEYSQDKSEWISLGPVELAQATAAAGYTANTVVDLQGVAARYVRLTVNSGWSILGEFGLSEVRFFSIPVQAREPQPADEATTDNLDVVLHWRSGREAASHVISLSTDADAVVNAAAQVDMTDEPIYDLAGSNLEYGMTYYWSVTEINEAAVPSAYAGDLWHFNTPAYGIIDDFESYRDQESYEIWATWIDGYEVDTNGAIAGNDNDAETKVVYEGRQSLPIHYDNRQAVISEVTRTFDSPQDFTRGGADTLSLYYRGHGRAFEEEGNGTITVRGAGADIWNKADDFRYVWKRLQGDGSIVVRVQSLVNTHTFAKAGVMIRASLAPGSSFAGVYLTGGNGVHYQARLLADALVIADGDATATGQRSVRSPVWLKLERSGQSFTAYYATDEAATDWTAVPWSPRAISMPQDVYVGLAVTSHAVGQSTTAVFSGVTTTGVVIGMWATEAIGGEHPGNEPEPFYLVLEDNSAQTQTVYHPDPLVAVAADWRHWQIPFMKFGTLNLNNITKMTIGLGDPGLSLGGQGTLYIDNIGMGKFRTSE